MIDYASVTSPSSRPASSRKEVKELFPSDSPRAIGLVIMQAMHEKLLQTGPGHTPGWVTFSMPYAKAICQMHGPFERYGLEDGEMIAAYLLNNLTNWRGPVAAETKLRIKALWQFKG